MLLAASLHPLLLGAHRSHFFGVRVPLTTVLARAIRTLAFSSARDSDNPASTDRGGLRGDADPPSASAGTRAPGAGRAPRAPGSVCDGGPCVPHAHAASANGSAGGIGTRVARGVAVEEVCGASAGRALLVLPRAADEQVEARRSCGRGRVAIMGSAAAGASRCRPAAGLIERQAEVEQDAYTIARGVRDFDLDGGKNRLNPNVENRHLKIDDAGGLRPGTGPRLRTSHG